MRKIYLVIAIFALMGNLFSYSLLDKDAGSAANNADARTVAMGGAATAGSTTLMGSLQNPANIVSLEDGFGSQFSLAVMKNDDDRKLAMFDFFDGYVDDATYASNTNFYDEYSFATYNRFHKNDYAMGIAWSYIPLLNFDSDYEEEVRNDGNSDGNDYPKVLAYNLIKGRGSVNALGYTLSFSYKNKYSIGFYHALLEGDNDYHKEVNWTDYANLQNAGLEDYDFREKIDYDGEMFRIGASYNVNERFDLGLTYQPELELDATTKIDTFKADYKFKLPSELRAGVVYQPRNIARTYFNMDVEMVDWESISSAYDNVINYYIGVEHKFQYGVPLRFGFRYVTEYRAQAGDYCEKITSPTFTAGSGFEIVDGLVLDIGFEFMNREYEDMDLFADSFYDETGLWDNISPQDRTDPDTVSENLMKVQTSLSYKW